MTIESTSDSSCLDAVVISLDHVIETVDDRGGFDEVSDSTLIRFMQGFEPLDECLSQIQDHGIAELTNTTT